MKIIYDQNLKTLATTINNPLYIVGGYVRNFLGFGFVSKDVDLAGTIDEQTLSFAVQNVGGKILATYKRTGTVVFGLGGIKYEYTQFRKDDYSAGGKHQPDCVQFTDDILQDALRRDFKCNAVYYDVKNDAIIDPLNAIPDIQNKVLDTVKKPQQVFCHDGLRLMRLARFCGELGYTPTEQVLDGARQFADNVLDVSVERITEEIKKCLVADSCYPFSPQDGHYLAFKVLDKTRVLDKIMPELTLGRGIEQRKDFHDWDVLEHSLKALYFAPKNLRLAGLLHDVGKPKTFINTGRFHGHDKVGEQLVYTILKRLKFDNKTIEKTMRLTFLHMRDYDLKTSEKKVLKIMAGNLDILQELYQIKQVDYSGCKGDIKECPTITRWKGIFEKAQANGVPFTVKQLKVSATDLLQVGVDKNKLSQVLNALLEHCLCHPQDNDKNRLLSLATNRFLTKKG